MAGGSEMRLEPAQAEQLDAWFDASLARWQELASTLPPQDGARLEPGHFAVGYSLNGDLMRLSLPDLKEALRQATIRHTGWPEFLVPTRQGIAPYPKDGNIECWIGGDKEKGPRDGAHSDFWCVSLEGKAFLIRGLQEDAADFGAKPGTAFEITTPSWRIGEALLHASALAKLLGDPQAEVVLVAEWTGLKGRQLAAHPSNNRFLFDGHTTQEERYRGTVTARADEIPTILAELVRQMLAPLYELFDFFQLPAALPAEELAKMRRNTF
jgi:hypothetical protein